MDLILKTNQNQEPDYKMGLKNLLTNLEGAVGEVDAEGVSNTYPNHDIYNHGQSTSIFDKPHGNVHFGFRQKNIRFGRDTKDGGDSGQPFIQRTHGQFGRVSDTHTPLDEGSNSIILDNVIDGDVRGGLTTYNNRRYIDLARFNKWLATPQGKQWNSNQTLLQATNPKPNHPVNGLMNMGSFKDLWNQVTSVNPNQRTWNLGQNTAEQIRLGNNLHIPREGLIPYMHDGYVDYAKKAFSQNKEQSNNRLLSLANKTGIVGEEKEGASGLLGWIQGAVSFGTNAINKIGGRGEELYSYGGGPGSDMGFGRTFIGRYTNTRMDNWGNDFVKPHTSYDPIFDTQTNYIREGYIEDLSNMTKSYRLGAVGVQKTSTNNGEVYTEGPTMGDHVRIINPETKGFTYNVYNDQKTDKLNMLDVFSSEAKKLDNTKLPDDFIKFRIEAVNSMNPSTSNFIIFRAFLDDVSDNFTAKHNEFNYNGRPESFYTYKGFNRDISLSFKIAAQTRHEMMPLYRKLNYLVSNVAPDYSSQRMVTPYIKLTVGDWINRTPGVINSINLKWQKDYPWETAHSEIEDIHMLELPHVLDVSMKFTPIHNFLPRKSMHAPFILPHKNNSPNLPPSKQWTSIGVATDITTAMKPYFERIDPEKNPGVPIPLGHHTNKISPNNKLQGLDLEETIDPKDVANSVNQIIAQKLSSTYSNLKKYLRKLRNPVVASGEGGTTGNKTDVDGTGGENGASDRRLKKNINLIGSSPSGLNIYSFKYKDSKYGSGLFQGVMSDEIPQQAVFKVDGYDHVDYGMLDVEFKQI